MKNKQMAQGIYEQVINKEIKEKLKALDVDKYLIEKESIDVEEAKTVLSNYISLVIKKSLRFIRENFKADDKEEALLSQIKACNELIESLSKLTKDKGIEDFKIDEKGEMLTALYSKINNARAVKGNRNKILRPVTPLSQSSLFTGTALEPDMMSEIKKEILTSDAVDLLISFVKWSGLKYVIYS